VVLSRSTAAAVAAWCLVALTGCGGGGGGGDKKPPTAELPVVPVGDSTNYTVMSMDPASSVVLSGYGMASQTYHVAAGGLWSDTSVVTGMDFSANVAGVTDVRSLPSSLSVEWSFSGVPVDYPGGDYNASLPVTTLTMSVASHPVAGITLLRHASGTQATALTFVRQPLMPQHSMCGTPSWHTGSTEGRTRVSTVHLAKYWGRMLQAYRPWEAWSAMPVQAATAV
jgi:hypothetical protein